MEKPRLEAPRSSGLGLFLTQHAGALVVKAMLKGGAAETSGACARSENEACLLAQSNKSYIYIVQLITIQCTIAVAHYNTTHNVTLHTRCGAASLECTLHAN